MGSKAKLLAEIAAVENQLKIQQWEVSKHSQELKVFWRENKVAIIASLIPIALLGWHLGKRGQLAPLLKHATKLVVQSAVGSLKLIL